MRVCLSVFVSVCGVRAAANVRFSHIFIKILVFGYQKSVVFGICLTCVLYSVLLEVILFTCTLILADL